MDWVGRMSLLKIKHESGGPGGPGFVGCDPSPESILGEVPGSRGAAGLLYDEFGRLLTVEGVGGVMSTRAVCSARRGPGRGRGLPRMEVLTPPIRKISTCLTPPWGRLRLP